ncbi:hypothetical protein pb186bvf_016051 [Paramecium bursaria]
MQFDENTEMLVYQGFNFKYYFLIFKQNIIIGGVLTVLIDFQQTIKLEYSLNPSINYKNQYVKSSFEDYLSKFMCMWGKRGKKLEACFLPNTAIYQLQWRHLLFERLQSLFHSTCWIQVRKEPEL